jgi:DNA polymerase-3 subunit delta'
MHLAPLSNTEMRAFASTRGLTDIDRRIALASGSPGLAVSMDLDAYDDRRAAMLTLLEVAAGRAPFSEWAKCSEAIAARKQEKLDLLLRVLYHLLEDILLLSHDGGEIRNLDRRAELQSLADGVSFPWIRAALKRADELSELVVRNIQKSIALDAFAVEMRQLSPRS